MSIEILASKLPDVMGRGGWSTVATLQDFLTENYCYC